MGDKQIGVSARWCSCIKPELLEGDGALGDGARVLHQHDIAGHQVRAGESGELIVGEVPRLHAKEHAERAAFDDGFPEIRIQELGPKEALGVLRIVFQNVRAEHHFSN